MKLVVWNRVGQRVAGKLVEIRDGKAFRNHQSRIAELRQKDGRTIAIVLTRLLDEEFEDRDVRVGDRIAIKYIGSRTSKSSGRSYKRFRIETR